MNNLDEYESKQLLQKYNVPVVENELVNSLEEATQAIEDIGLPVVIKVVSSDLKHKTEAGAIEKVHSWDDIDTKYFDILDSAEEYDPDMEIKGVLVEEAVEGDEFILGVNQDSQFGHVIMFGLGGIYVEVFEDTSFRVLPVDEYDIRTMIKDLKSSELLEGVRDGEKVNFDKLKDTFFNICDLVREEDVKELDINPLFIKGDMIKAADALITINGDDV